MYEMQPKMDEEHVFGYWKDILEYWSDILGCYLRQEGSLFENI
ncbi:MAG: hypothetical protein H6Q19_609 [Bacteroidetes bacterium]|nr:hypothetical protein [Bacteroidota bacterium]